MKETSNYLTASKSPNGGFRGLCIIAEKPSVARDIARIVEANQKQDGYLTGNDYTVT